MIVVLRTPSVAQRVAETGFATEAAERRWTAEAFAAQQQVLTQLARHGLTTHPDYSYARVLDGFSALLDPRAVALLQRNPEVAGVYPVRIAYPAALGSAPTAAEPGVPAAGLAGFDGTGITIALLDTGVDLADPYLGGRVEPGFDVVGGTGTAAAQRNPQRPHELERHGTRSPACSSARAAPTGPTGSPRGRPSFRSGLPAGSRPPAGRMRSTPVRTS